MMRRCGCNISAIGHLLSLARFVKITEVTMPALSPTMTKGTIASWNMKVGSEVKPNSIFARVETDKSTLDFENQVDEGFVARLLVEEGRAVALGTTICLLVDDAKDITSTEVATWSGSDASGGEIISAPSAPVSAPQTVVTPSTTTTGTERVFASPLAKVTAQQLGVNLATVKGSGGDVGRIVKEDVVKASQALKAAPPRAERTTTTQQQAAASSADSFYDTPITSMRATIAQRLVQSKNVEIPHFYIMNHCKVANMLATIKHLNTKGAGKYKITINDYIVKAVARANLIVPQCNSQWKESVIRTYLGVDVSIAVATPTGLITPIIKNAHIKGLVQISMETKELSRKAKEGALLPAEFIGGTVTVSNMGSMGVSNFTAIINPPQSMILACGSIESRPEIIKSETTEEFTMTGKVEQVMNCTASFDHRIVDGAIGAEWWKHFKDAVENPTSLLL